MNIGFRIRNLRLKKKLTQKELAERLNVTSGYISQIENNLISPSLKILFSLLKILKISTSDFFQQEKNIELIHKKNDFLCINNKNLKNSFYYLFPNEINFRMEPIIIEIETKGQTNINFHKTKEDIFCFVLEGEVTLILDNFRYFLKKGDTFYLSTDKNYYFFNHYIEVARILKVIAPPSLDLISENKKL